MESNTARLLAKPEYCPIELGFGRKSIKFPTPLGKRTKHGIPLVKLKIMGKNGLRELRAWIKEWLTDETQK